MTPREQVSSQRLSQGRFRGLFGSRSGGVPRGLSGRLRPLALAGILGVLALVLSGCSWQDVFGFGWPQGITPQAHLNRELWLGAVIASLVVGAIVWGLIFWSSAFHRKKATDTDLPRQFGYNMPLELVLTVTPFLIISVLFYFTVVVQEKMLHLAKDPEVVIDVTAFQWNWKFGYRSVNFKDGTLTYDGADPARKNAMLSKPEGKDAHGEELVGPVRGRNTADRTYLNFDKVETLGTTERRSRCWCCPPASASSSCWSPRTSCTRSGCRNSCSSGTSYPTPRRTTPSTSSRWRRSTSPGAFVGHCAEFCGTYHSMMNFEVRVVSPNDFKAYLQQRIDGKSNAESLQAIGQAPLAVTTHPFDTRRGQLAASQ